MNRECNGDRFRINDGTFHYRCFWDGKIINEAIENGMNCPNCNREVDANKDIFEAKVRVVRQVQMPTWEKEWVNLP